MWNILASLLISVTPHPASPPGQVPGSSLEGIGQAIIRMQWEKDQLLALQRRQQAAAKPKQRTSVNWDGIARCETGGDWSMVGPKFSGGVGFYNGTWNSFGGREFAAYAGQATREQQIIVAERVYARYGLSGWGCRAYG